jgi:hypothetical protein
MNNENFDTLAYALHFEHTDSYDSVADFAV